MAKTTVSKLQAVVNEVVPLTLILFVPGLLLATNFRLPGTFMEKHPDNWLYILLPLILCHSFVILGHTLMVTTSEVALWKVLCALSLPFDALIGIPWTILRSVNSSDNKD